MESREEEGNTVILAHLVTEQRQANKHTLKIQVMALFCQYFQGAVDKAFVIAVQQGKAVSESQVGPLLDS